MMRIECPKCGSESFDVNDMEGCYSEGTHYDYCYCEECGADFYVKYIAVDIVGSDD
jgi:hypothetical protein